MSLASFSNVSFSNPVPPKQANHRPSSEWSASFPDTPLSFIGSALETLEDGVVILTELGQLVYANCRGRYLCRQLSQKPLFTETIPATIWQVCLALIESRELFPGQSIVLESEAMTHNFKSIRLQVSYLDDLAGDSCLLVKLTNRHRFAENRSITVAQNSRIQP